MNAPALFVSMTPEQLAWQRQHEAVIRGRQMEAIATWPVADQIKLLRQIATDIHTERTFSRTAQHEALIVMDQADELERLLVIGTDNDTTGLVPVTARRA